LGTVILIPLINLINAWLGGAGRGIAFMVFGAIIIVACLIQPDGLIKYFEGRGIFKKREYEVA